MHNKPKTVFNTLQAVIFCVSEQKHVKLRKCSLSQPPTGKTERAATGLSLESRIFFSILSIEQCSFSRPLKFKPHSSVHDFHGTSHPYLGTNLWTEFNWREEKNDCPQRLSRALNQRPCTQPTNQKAQLQLNCRGEIENNRFSADQYRSYKSCARFRESCAYWFQRECMIERKRVKACMKVANGIQQ